MALFYFESDMGCGIRDYRNLKEAVNGITKEVGTSNGPMNISKATKKEVDWVKNMGGNIPS